MSKISKQIFDAFSEYEKCLIANTRGELSNETITKYTNTLKKFKNYVVHYDLFPFTGHDVNEYFYGLIKDSDKENGPSLRLVG